MKLRFFAFGVAFGVAAVLGTGQVHSGDENAPKIDEEMFKQWQKFALPNENHRRLKTQEGVWRTEMKMYMDGPDEPPTINWGTQRSKLVFGGRFLRTEIAGTMKMEIEGEMMEIPIEGLGFTGYDNFKEKYVSVWIDSHATGIWFSEGTFDEATSTYTHVALFDDWQTNQRDKPIKFVERSIDEDTIEAGMYDLSTGVEPTLIWEQILYRTKDKSSR